ncbi:LysR family transcriptional regulator [Nocardia cyriacigeorgica]|uniref:LysR family transcriptional regulator n=1 Tax=Nocardia cyriacigeorgica TaxID=135487 RepID=UPI001894A4EF|nr:LysR family transcriptional regulator [Nocardia cyriacigeorgica]MBF6454172.1 LysR family transcriptional regulator [Nocardia cyriacigeorgica]MBF6477882.1 LysR family transcriptional regulator [Nocardia cyriacigeorgica]MBF6552066.1 LysR family transcriptional regulator [Nocardia cyriacigeorgica]
MDVELRHLRAFVALCEEANYTRAAACLHLSQPALTRTIQQLERLLECRLIERSSRHFALTDEGRELLDRGRGILADVDAVRADLGSRSAVELGFSWLLPDEWFTETRTRFEQLGGRIALRRIDDPLTALTERTIDIAIYRTGNGLPRHLRSRPIATERRVLAVASASPLATATGLRWAGLAHEPLVVNTISGTTTAASWDPPDPARPVITCTNFDEWIELVAAGRGIGVVPELARVRAPHPGVVYRDLPDAPPSRVRVAWRAEPSRAVRRFLEVA